MKHQGMANSVLNGFFNPLLSMLPPRSLYSGHLQHPHHGTATPHILGYRLPNWHPEHDMPFQSGHGFPFYHGFPFHHGFPFQPFQKSHEALIPTEQKPIQEVTQPEQMQQISTMEKSNDAHLHGPHKQHRASNATVSMSHQHGSQKQNRTANAPGSMAHRAILDSKNHHTGKHPKDAVNPAQKHLSKPASDEELTLDPAQIPQPKPASNANTQTAHGNRVVRTLFASSEQDEGADSDESDV